MDKVESNQCKNMQDAVNDDCSYKFVYSNPILDEFLEEWRDEINGKKNFPRLNDDCLRKIFSFLPAMGLCAVRETCNDFRRVSDYCFDKRSKSFRLSGKFIYDSPGDFLKEMDAVRTFRNFGQFIRTVSIEQDIFLRYEYTPRLLRAIDRYCPNLTDFALDIIDSMSPFISQRLFSNLHRLVIKNCQSEPTIRVDAILQHCTSLKHLKLIDWELFRSEEGNMRLESLESLSLIRCVVRSSITFKDLFSRNDQLRSLAFLAYKNQGAGYIPMNTIPTELVEASILPSSKQKQLKIDVDSIQLFNSLFDLAKQKSIESLHIIADARRVDIVSVELLCSLKTLRILKFTGSDPANVNVSRMLACELPNLVEISFIDCYARFETIEQFVRYSKNLKKIVFYRHFAPQPITTRKLFFLVRARLQNKQNIETMTLFLNKWEIRKVQNDGGSNFMEKHRDIIQLLPFDLEEGLDFTYLYQKTSDL